MHAMPFPFLHPCRTTVAFLVFRPMSPTFGGLGGIEVVGVDPVVTEVEPECRFSAGALKEVGAWSSPRGGGLSHFLLRGKCP